MRMRIFSGLAPPRRSEAHPPLILPKLVATIRRAELAVGPTALTAANDQAIRRALESAGVEFIDEVADQACAFEGRQSRSGENR
jgi:hypothetical protein